MDMSPGRKRWGCATLSRPQASDDRQALASRDTRRPERGKRPPFWRNCVLRKVGLKAGISCDAARGVFPGPFRLPAWFRLLFSPAPSACFFCARLREAPICAERVPASTATTRNNIWLLHQSASNKLQRRADYRKEHIAGTVRVQPLSLVKLICETQPLTLQLEGLDDETHE